MKYILTIIAATLFAFTAQAFERTLSWNDNSDNENGFKIEESVDDGPFVQIGTVGADVNTYLHDLIESGHVYAWRVRAYNEFGDSGYTNKATLNANPPVDPGNLVALAIAGAGLGVLILLFVTFGLNLKGKKRS
jgi:hypothetical protein